MIAAAYSAHTIGTIVLVGSLAFAPFVYLPAMADVRGSATRMRLRLEALELSFRGAWLGVGLIYGSGIWGIWGASLFKLPAYIAWMTGLSVPLLLLLLIGQFVLLPEARHAMEVKQVKAARHWYPRLRALMLIILVVALAALLLGASGAAF